MTTLWRDSILRLSADSRNLEKRQRGAGRYREVGLAETARMVAETGSRAVVHRANVADPAQTAAYVAHALDVFGRIDGLFNNAGIQGAIAPLCEYPDDDFDRVMAVNLKGVYLGLKHVLPVWCAKGPEAWSTPDPWLLRGAFRAWLPMVQQNMA